MNLHSSSPVNTVWMNFRYMIYMLNNHSIHNKTQDIFYIRDYFHKLLNNKLKDMKQHNYFRDKSIIINSLNM